MQCSVWEKIVNSVHLMWISFFTWQHLELTLDFPLRLELRDTSAFDGQCLPKAQQSIAAVWISRLCAKWLILFREREFFFTEKPFEYQTQSKKCSYNDSSKIFGNGICCKKISSSNESFVVDMDVAIKWANFQHCTMSELPYFSATKRLCWHISSNKMRFSQFTCSNWQM